MEGDFVNKAVTAFRIFIASAPKPPYTPGHGTLSKPPTSDSTICIALFCPLSENCFLDCLLCLHRYLGKMHF